MKRADLEKEFIGIIRDYERIVYKVCTFYVSDESPMADLYQEVVLNLWKGYSKFRNECTLSTWIYRVTLNMDFHVHLPALIFRSWLSHKSARFYYSSM